MVLLFSMPGLDSHATAVPALCVVYIHKAVV